MKQLLKPIFALTICAILASPPIWAGEGEEMIIELKTHDFEVAATDIGELAIGESKTIETESGKIIDILRTSDGAEIYIDGELLEMNATHEGMHEVHKIEKHVEIVCDDEEDCEKQIFVVTDGEPVDFGFASSEGDNVFIHKEIELSCTDDEDSTSCSETSVWVTGDGEIDLQELHEMHGDGKTHKVIIIKKEVITED